MKLKTVSIVAGSLVLILLSAGMLTAVSRSRTKPVRPVAFKGADKAKNIVDLTTPETTLQTYIRSMQLGDWPAVLQCYDLKELPLSKPVPIKNYQITKKIVFDPDQQKNWLAKGMPAVQPGDVELQVKLFYQSGPLAVQDDHQANYSYLLRRVETKWMIFAHIVRNSAS